MLNVSLALSAASVLLAHRGLILSSVPWTPRLHLPPGCVLAAFACMRLLASTERWRAAAAGTASIYAAAGLGLAAVYGYDLPQALLTLLFATVCAAAFLGSRITAAYAAATVSSYGLISYMQIVGMVPVIRAWRRQGFTPVDAVIAAATMLAAAAVITVNERHLRKGLAALRLERAELKVRVAERSERVMRVERDQLEIHDRYAEFGRTASGLLHDLNNPLTVLMLHAEELSGKAGGSDAATRVIAAVRRLERYILTRGGDPAVAVHTADLTEEVDAVLAGFRRRLQDAGVQAEADVPTNLPMRLDVAAFSRLIQNLIANAIAACAEVPRERMRVLVRLLSGDRTVTLSVIDRGAGMPADVQRRAFDPFFGTTPGGSGLGLAVVREMTARLDAELTLRSSPEGTGFTLVMPRHPRYGRVGA